MLDKLKLLLGISDSNRDELLNLIIGGVAARLKNLLGGIAVPVDLEHIVLDVSAIRFNRIGSEGMDSHSVEGESLSFWENDFAGYMDEIQAWLDENGTSKKGKVRFL